MTKNMTTTLTPTLQTSSAPQSAALTTLLPIAVAVFIGFLTIGLAMPVLPLHLKNALGMGPIMVGAIIGCQFAAALLTRAWAGTLTDTKGAKRSMVVGLVIAILCGVTYSASLTSGLTPQAVTFTLVSARLLLGCAESLIVTGALSWGIGLVGPQNAGKVMAWVGIAMYAAYAIGAPLGVTTYRLFGFEGIAMTTMFIPLLALCIIAWVRPIAPTSTQRIPFYKVLGSVWIPGLGLALSSAGFGTITAFISILFASHAWGNASLAFTSFGVAFIGARLLFGHLPDKLGGARVALVCVLIEALGQLLIWGSVNQAIAYAGAALTGFGYSLAFPGFGVEAVRRAPPQSRGSAMGAYVAFLDISLAITGPGTGVIASLRSVDTVYLAGAISVGCAVLVALYLRANVAIAAKSTA